MIHDEQWQKDMRDGVLAACQTNLCAVGLLNISIKEPIDHQRMNADTCHRTDGKCPTQRGYLQRQFTALVEVFERVNQKLNELRGGKRDV